MANSIERDTHRRVLLAFYDDQEAAEQALQQLMDLDFAPDRISVLGRASSSGDDPLGVYYATPGERMKAWGGMGAFWGGLWGLLTGAAGMFLVPGVGPVLAAGPVVEALTGAAAGAGVVGGAMAGGAALSQLTVAVHRMGVPEEHLDETRRLLEQGHTPVMLIAGEDEVPRWREVLGDGPAEPLWDFPYMGFREAAGEAL